MEQHRSIKPLTLDLYSANQPFSCFDWADDAGIAIYSVRRCFSLARSQGMKSFVVEEIPASGIIEEENSDILAVASDYKMPMLLRISFWDREINSAKEINSFESASLCGYMIVKHDYSKALDVDSSHLFEAVFRKYPHEHNCVPQEKSYHVVIGDQKFTIPGVLYAQQNNLNKVCAHVALRTLLSRRLERGDVSYREINQIVEQSSGRRYQFGCGLTVQDIRAVLNHYGIPFRDIDYEDTGSQYVDMRKTHPYQKYIYSGVESGCGALLGFSLESPAAGRHIIPFYGHTFNKDTWAPDADMAYFDVGNGVGYIPSESWTSSFLGHDDNFGPNFCVPRLYVKPEQVQYVVELLSESVAYSGVHAEAITLIFLYSLWEHIRNSTNRWMQRLADASHPKNRRVVLRAICITSAAYLRHFKEEKDWDGELEFPLIASIFEKILPERVWVVEVSLPHLFPANEHKLGEIVLNPFVSFDGHQPINYDLFLFARLPGSIFVLNPVNSGPPEFLEVPSKCKSHRAVIRGF